MPKGDNTKKFSSEKIRELRAAYIPHDARYGAAALARRHGIDTNYLRRVLRGEARVSRPEDTARVGWDAETTTFTDRG